MKKNLLCLSIIFLGISLIISALILSRSRIEYIHTFDGNVHGSLGLLQSSTMVNEITDDILVPNEAGSLLGYNGDDLIRDIENGVISDIPYVYIGGEVRFSKKALEEWIYQKSIE